MMAKITTFILMTILFVSQSFAFNPMDCQQHLDPTIQTIVQNKLNPSSDASILTGTISDKSMDCCEDIECSCPVGACQSVGSITLHLNTSVTINADKVFLSLFAVSEPYTPHLKKPPIKS